MRRVFNDLDVNGDGSIDRKELSKVFNELGAAFLYKFVYHSTRESSFYMQLLCNYVYIIS